MVGGVWKKRVGRAFRRSERTLPLSRAILWLAFLPRSILGLSGCVAFWQGRSNAPCPPAGGSRGDRERAGVRLY